MRRKYLSLALVFALSFPSIAFASSESEPPSVETPQEIVDEISILQSEIMSNSNTITQERSNIANIERNIELVRLSNQQRQEELSRTTDPQIRDYLQNQIDGWNRWVQNDMYAELTERNFRLNSALTNVMEIQKQISSLETTLKRNVESTLSDPKVSIEEQVLAVESYTRALENAAQTRQYEIQNEIKLMVAFRNQADATPLGSSFRTTMLEESKKVEVLANKSSEILIAQQMVIEAQKTLAESIKTVTDVIGQDQPSGEVSNLKPIEVTDDTKSKLNYLATSIENVEFALSEINLLIQEKQKSINNLLDLVATLEDGSERRDEANEAIDILKQMIGEADARKKEIEELESKNSEILKEIKEETLVERFTTVFEDVIESTKPGVSSDEVLEFKRGKKGKFKATLEIPKPEFDFMVLEDQELENLEVVAKRGAKETKLEVSIVLDDQLEITFGKTPRKGEYAISVLHSENNEEIEFPVKVKVKK